MTGTAAERTARLLGLPAESLGPVSGGSICRAERLRLSDGRLVLAKTLGSAPAGFFAAEAAGLAWLRETGTVAVPRVLGADDHVIVLEWIEQSGPTPVQAERLGRQLAALHCTRADGYGAPYPAYIGSLPLSSPPDQLPGRRPAGPSGQRAAEQPGQAQGTEQPEQPEQPGKQRPPSGHGSPSPVDWPGFYTEHRLLPFLRQATDNGAVAPADARAIERLCEVLPQVSGPPQPPAVIHGDLWSGNVLWAADGRARLIDPATQGGHPESDLAMLELFGCPQLPRLLAAYEEVRPLPCRRDRVPVHQLHPLLVHAVLFGGAYGSAAGRAARQALGLADGQG